jgi:hypothetical protein
MVVYRVDMSVSVELLQPGHIRPTPTTATNLATVTTPSPAVVDGDWTSISSSRTFPTAQSVTQPLLSAVSCSLLPALVVSSRLVSPPR